MPQFCGGRGEHHHHLLLHNKRFFGLLSVFVILLVTTSCHPSRSAAALGETNTNNFYEDDGVCLSNYDMSDGSIIRANDSLAVGARYIHESDLGAKSRDDCFRLCCRTTACNVAVFEEKNSGSCYMFDCGTPEDFRCKFTAQPHYIVAVLKRRDILQERQQQLTQQQQQQQLHNFHSNTQHETELSQLRNGASDKGTANSNIPSANVNVNANTASKSKQEEESLRIASSSGSSAVVGSSSNGNIITSTTTTTTAASLTAGVVDNKSQGCSHYQFECKSTKDCIAIYNVCDGVKQCLDGSDESVELHCPSGDPVIMSKMEIKPKASMILPIALPQGGPQQLTSGRMHNELGMNSMSKPSQEDFRLAQSSSSSQALGSKSESLKIFNHKEGGILDETYGAQLQQQMHNPYWKNYDYSNVETPINYGSSLSMPAVAPGGSSGNPNGLYGSSMNSNMNNNYGSGSFAYSGYPPQQQSQSQMPRPPGGAGLTQISPYSNTIPLQQQQQYYNNNPNNPLMFSGNSNNNMMNQNPVYMDPSRFLPPDGRMQSGLQQQHQQQPQMQSTAGTTTTVGSTTTTLKSMTTGRPLSASATLNQQQNGGGVITSAIIAVPKTQAEKLESRVWQIMKNPPFNIETEIQSQADEPEDHSAGAGAAFVFIMGVGMSIVMVIIVGCRLRRIGTRRRGKNRLDPDYLVDGMYL